MDWKSYDILPCKTYAKLTSQKGSLEMLEPISKHDITKHVQNNNPFKSYKEKKNF